MQYIDEKFKDCDPKETVKKIQGIFESIGLRVTEKWYDSGLDNCYSVSVTANNGVPTSTGKGITKDFARASGYAELIERIQAGLHVNSFQSIIRESDMNIHTFAPDGKYMTVEELVENGEWMDHIIESYKDPKITRETIAEKCRVYDCADDGKILTLPFYSLFEKKYVYLPISFVGRMYTANGNCAGNSREEAWVHALSEMMERKATQKALVSGSALPRIPEETIKKFPTVSRIIEQIRENGDFDVDIFDYSIGNGFPVISTRIINKKTHSYRVNVAADPVFEIAIQRTLTEIFQGKNVRDFTVRHSGRILNKVSDFSIASNITNQLCASEGLYTADYFANELTCTAKPTEFADNSNKTNKELLEYLLGLYKQLGKPVYVRNYSFLGFNSYKFVVPGFSETRWVRLNELIPEYAIADRVCNTYKNPAAATEDDLKWLLSHSNMIKAIIGRYSSFGAVSGVPLSGSANLLLVWVTRAYAAYRLNDFKEAMKYLKSAVSVCFDEETKEYFTCVNKYLELKSAGIDEEKIRVILYKFFISKYPDQLYANLDNNLTPYDEYLLRCDLESCEQCKYKDVCSYNDIKSVNRKIGSIYSKFVNGQAPSEFTI